MYIHKQFLKEHIGRDVKAQNAFAFFLLLKKTYPNSVIYEHSSRCNLARKLKMDVRTFNKWFEDIIKRGWCKPSGKHIKLKSINKEYEYRELENGKANKRKNQQYLTVTLTNLKTIKELRSLVRLLLVKPLYQSKLYCKFDIKRREKLSKEEQKVFYELCYGLGRKRKESKHDNADVSLPLNTIGKIMGVSKSTAERTMDTLAKAGLVLKKSGDLKIRCSVRQLPKQITGFKYGTYSFGGHVFTKKMNSYAF